MVSRCFDKNIVSKIINHPKVRDWLIDDGTKNMTDVIIHPDVIYLVDDSENGVIRADKMNSVTCNLHIATTPKMWGGGHSFAGDAIIWGFKNTPYMKFVAIIPEFNKFTIKMVEDVGFKREGILKKSFMKNWKLHDQIIFGLSKGDM